MINHNLVPPIRLEISDPDSLDLSTYDTFYFDSERRVKDAGKQRVPIKIKYVSTRLHGFSLFTVFIHCKCVDTDHYQNNLYNQTPL